MDFPSKFLWAGNICDFFLSVRFCHRRRKTHAIAISVVSLESMVPSEVWALILSKIPPAPDPPRYPPPGTRPCPDHLKMLVYGESQKCVSGLLVCQNPEAVLQNDCIGAPRSECRWNQLGGAFWSGPLQFLRSREIQHWSPIMMQQESVTVGSPIMTWPGRLTEYKKGVPTRCSYKVFLQGVPTRCSYKVFLQGVPTRCSCRGRSVF